MKFLNFLLIVSLILFSSCAMPGVTTSSTPKEDTSGEGLLMTLTLDTSPSSNQVQYTLQFENSGKQTLTLSQNNLILSTREENQPFTQDSLDNFYSAVFSSGEITLEQNQKSALFRGFFVISDNYFKDLTKQTIHVSLSYSTDAKTEFVANSQINLKTLDFTSGLIAQAAPLQVNALELQSYDQDSSLLQFTLNNKIPSSYSSQISVATQTISLGNQNLNTCKYFYKDGDALVEKNNEDFTLTNKDRTIFYTCKISNAQYQDSTQTQIIGEIDYNYKEILEKTITLPSKRVSSYSTSFT